MYEDGTIHFTPVTTFTSRPLKSTYAQGMIYHARPIPDHDLLRKELSEWLRLKLVTVVDAPSSGLKGSGVVR